jgi:sigma-B regulation protein RsbU (phosphoserine phosphatase)
MSILSVLISRNILFKPVYVMNKQDFSYCSECPNYDALLRKSAFFQDISNQIVEKKPADKLLKDIIESSKRLLQAEASSLLLYDEAKDRLFFYVAEGEAGKLIRSNAVEIGQGIAGWVAKHKKMLRIDDCYADERFNPAFDKKTGFVTRNMLCAPMLRNGQLIGVLQVMNKMDAPRFDEQDEFFFNTLVSQCAIAIENFRLNEIELQSERLETELNTARSIQRRILPSSLPEVPVMDIEIMLEPAKHLGGDYYNLIRLNKRQSLVFVADVAGKSISAALIVASVYSFIHTYLILYRENIELSHFVSLLNTFVAESTTPEKFVTAWFGVIDEQERNLTSISAGHEPVYLLNAGDETLKTLTEGGMLLGMMKDMPYQSEVIPLQKDDLLVFYTDGITEAMNRQEEEYTSERLESQIIAHAGQSSKELLELILSDVYLHQDGAPQSDDITIGVMKVR